MARTVDPERYAARRLGIVDAALTRFASDGYAGTSTAAICREAGIASGTFFHYFPTKADVLLAILDLGTQETRGWFAERVGSPDAVAVVRAWVRHSADEMGDPRLPGFVRAVGAVMSEPRVADALAADEHAQRDGLLPWVRTAQERGEVRTDLAPERVTTWVMLLLDGYAGRLATEPAFAAQKERAVLLETVDRFLAPAIKPARPRPNR